MNVLITLTTAGIDTGPFNLYSNTDSYVTAFQTNIAKSLLVAGYTSTVVPAGTTYVRVKSTGLCTNYIDIYVTGSGTTTTTTTATPTTTTTTTQVVTYYNVVLCGTSTTTVIRHNGPNNVTLGVVVQSTNGSCYTVSSVGTGPETVGTLLTQFASCVLCQGAPPPTTTTTSTSTSTSTTTSTSTSTTTTTTTSILTSCEEWRNDTLEEATITYTPCNSVTPVSNYALATTSSVCAVYGSITVTVGGPLTLVGSCNTPGPTTTTTTTAIPQEWYQLTNCTTLAVDYSWNYNVGSYSINERVTDFLLNTYRITATYSSNPGGSNLFIATTGQTGCPSGTTTTTTQAPPVGTNILVVAETVAGSDLDCLGTPYPRSITTVTATVYDQYGNITNVVGSAITVTVNTTYNPCYGGSIPGTYNIIIPGGNTASGASVNWDSSRTVDCGGFGCLLETDTYDCAASNTASLPFRAGTITC
jgi:hypothetical protein